MRLLTTLAVTALAAGIYHYKYWSRDRALRQAQADERLAQQVRQAIRAAVADPGPVDVCVSCGVVTLRGEVKKVECDVVVAAALAVPGVIEVADFLDSDEPMGEIGTLHTGIATGP